MHRGGKYPPSSQILSFMSQVKKRVKWNRVFGAATLMVSMAVILIAWIIPNPEQESENLTHPGMSLAEQSLVFEEDQMEDESHEPSVEIAAEVDDVVEEILPCACNRTSLKLTGNPYSAHQKAARNLPNSFFVKNVSELNAGKQRKKLVPVSDGIGYHIAPLQHSHAYLLPEVKSLLEDMGVAFANELIGTPSEGTTFRVTSMTRTGDQQEKLGRKNVNAIGESSTHSYGASFDIAFTDRPNNDADCSDPTWAIQRVIQSFQNSGRILVVPESGCIHITLRP